MIAALLFAASLADKPWSLTWSVDWGEGRNPTTHAARFEDFDEAITIADKAPLCSAPKDPPCVLWVKVRYSPPSEDGHIQRKDFHHGFDNGQRHDQH